MNKRKGFTLIELLVVIAIIAILAAILFPVFAKTRDKARETSCSSNEKQLALGVLQYVQDYDERFPAVWNSNTNMNWAQEIYSYVKSNGVFLCPSNALALSDNEAGQTMGNGFGGENPASTIPISYAMNGDLGFLNGNQYNYGPFHPLAGINEPSAKVMITETTSQNAATHWNGWFDCGGALCTSANATTSTVYTTLFSGHTTFMNVAYIDGHVKAVRPENLMTPIGAFGQVSTLGGAYPTSTDPNCTVNPTNQTNGFEALNCDDVSPSAVTAMAAISAEYSK